MGNIGAVRIENENGVPLSLDLSGNLNANVGSVSANISGQFVVLGSGSAVGLSGVSVITSVTTNVSGQAVFLGSGSFIPLSGLFVQISGQGVQISGQSVFLGSGSFAPLSGLFVNISGDPVSFFSGSNIVQQTVPTNIQIGFSGTAIQSGVPSLSGGTALQSAACISVTLRNSSGNDTMYVGGSVAGNQPFSGRGFQLGGGDSLTLPITNANKISVFAATSGQFVNWISVNF